MRSITNDLNPANGTTTVSGTIGGWSISVSSGTSFSPSRRARWARSDFIDGRLQRHLRWHQLHALFSDINFSPANPSFITQYSTTMTVTSGTASTSESAYFSNANTLFTESTLIGTVGPFNATGSGSATGGIGSVAPYSLTLDQVFNSGGSAIFSSDGSVASVPEPGAVMLFGTVLALCASKLRRRDSLRWVVGSPLPNPEPSLPFKARRTCRSGQVLLFLLAC